MMLRAYLRLRFYFATTGGALLRHWQWLLLAGLLVPGSALTILLVPAEAVAALSRAGAWSVAGWTAIGLAAALWVLPQRAAIRGGPLAPYAATLPLPTPTRIFVDLAVLLAADLLLVALLAVAAARGWPALLPELLGVPALALLVQWAVLQAPPLAAHRIVRRLPVSPPTRIRLGALVELPLPAITRIAAALGFAGLAGAFAAAVHFDARALPAAIVGLALAALVLAGLFRLLRDTHRPMAAFLATLPLPRWHLAAGDLRLVLTIGLVPPLMLLVWFGVLDAAVLLPLLAVTIAYLGLLALLRLPALWGGRLGAMLAAFIAAGWAGSAIAMVLR
jgi:hypothetical protein